MALARLLKSTSAGWFVYVWGKTLPTVTPVTLSRKAFRPVTLATLAAVAKGIDGGGRRHRCT
jgi:hypothetical protein